MKHYTKSDYEAYVNEVPIADADRKSNGGLIPDNCETYGTWMRRNDPIAFQVGYNEWRREACQS